MKIMSLPFENEPRAIKLVRALCDASGHTFNRVTGGDPLYQCKGQTTFAYLFLTDKRGYCMVDLDGKAMMFNGYLHELICEIDAPDPFELS